jgi:hypothetical protein
MGWSKVERVWLPSWLSERDEVVARIVQSATDAAVQHAEDVVEPVEPEPADTAEVRSTVETPVEPPVELAHGLELPVFVAADDSPTAGGRDLLDRLNERRVFDNVRAVAADIIRVESPIEATRLTRIVGRRFGLQRVVGTRSAVILAVVPRGLVHTSSLGTFVWADGTSPGSYREFRPTPAGIDRSIHEIAREEIANAMEHVARIGHGATPDELLRETAGIFGVRRLTEQIRVRLQQTLDWSVAAGRLREADGRIHV